MQLGCNLIKSSASIEFLIKLQIVKELHVVDWSDAGTAPVPYRSISDYIASSMKPRADHHGIFSDRIFDDKLQAVR